MCYFQVKFSFPTIFVNKEKVESRTWAWSSNRCHVWPVLDPAKTILIMVLIFNPVEIQMQFPPECYTSIFKLYTLPFIWQIFMYLTQCTWHNVGRFKKWALNLAVSNSWSRQSNKYWKLFFCPNICSIFLTFFNGNVECYCFSEICIDILRKHCQRKQIFEQALSFQNYWIKLEVY